MIDDDGCFGLHRCSGKVKKERRKVQARGRKATGRIRTNLVGSRNRQCWNDRPVITQTMMSASK